MIEHHGITGLPLPPEKGGGLGKPLKPLTHPVRDTIPVYAAALGPANVRVTAQLADGWLPFLYVPEHAAKAWGGPLAEGAASRDPALGPLSVVAGGLLATGEGAEAVRDLMRRVIALYAGGMGAPGRNFHHDLVCSYGYEAEAAVVQEHCLAGRKKDAEAAVPAELCELARLAGPEGYVRDRVEAFRDAGVTMLDVTPIGPDRARPVEHVRGRL